MIEQTEVFFRFLLVANKATLSLEQIKELSKVLLTILSNEQSRPGLVKYGFVPAANADYDSIRQYQNFLR